MERRTLTLIRLSILSPISPCECALDPFDANTYPALSVHRGISQVRPPDRSWERFLRR